MSNNSKNNNIMNSLEHWKSERIVLFSTNCYILEWALYYSFLGPCPHGTSRLAKKYLLLEQILLTWQGRLEIVFLCSLLTTSCYVRRQFYDKLEDHFLHESQNPNYLPVWITSHHKTQYSRLQYLVLISYSQESHSISKKFSPLMDVTVHDRSLKDGFA